SNTDLNPKILTKIQVDDLIDMIMKDGSFEEKIHLFADSYEKDEKIISPIGKQCGECEFTCPNDSEFKNGFKECWKAALGWSDKDFGDPNVLEVWDFRVKDKFIKE